MLTILRKSIGTWVAKIFILLLVASFGVWGVSGAIIGGSVGAVVQVGSTEVSPNDYVLAYERARFSLSRQFGRTLTREETRLFGIDNNVLNTLVSGAVLDESARSMGLGLSSNNLASLIGEDEAFQDASGRFDRRVLGRQLRQLGMSEEDYIRNRENVAIRNQLLEGISANTKSPEEYIKAYNKYRSEKRVFDYVKLTTDILKTPPVASGDDIKTHYEANKDSYKAPEFREIIIVELQPDDVSDPSAIAPEEIKEEYEARKRDYSTEEKRVVQQLSVEDEAAGEAIIKRLEDGELFETILSELGKTEKDIDLGEYTKSGLPDANVADAVFALELNKISKVVTGIFGPVLLRVTQITPETTKPLSEVEKDIRARLALVKAGDELYEIHDRLEDERAAGDSLVEAAAKVKLKPRTIKMIDAEGNDPDGNPVADIPEVSKLLAEAFETAQGVETDPISIGTSGFVWYEIGEIISPRQKPLDEVKDAVTQSWLETETANAVEKQAQEIKSKLESGAEFADALIAVLGDAGKNVTVEVSAELTREDTSNDLPTGAVRAGFSVAKGKLALAAGPDQGSQIVLKVKEIIASDNNLLGLEERKRLDETLSDDLLNQLIADLRQREPVLVNQSAIVAAQNLIR